MKIGYARVSTQEQDNQSQIQALTEAGCQTIFSDKASGGRWNSPELLKLLDYIREGDELIVWKLDRLARSLKDLLFLIERIDSKGAKFLSLTESIDTSIPAGRMMMQIVGSFAEFERQMLRERTLQGIKSAKQAGRVGGRKPALSASQAQWAIELIQSGQKTNAEVARLLRVHPATISRLFKNSGRT